MGAFFGTPATVLLVLLGVVFGRLGDNTSKTDDFESPASIRIQPPPDCSSVYTVPCETLTTAFVSSATE